MGESIVSAGTGCGEGFGIMVVVVVVVVVAERDREIGLRVTVAALARACACPFGLIEDVKGGEGMFGFAGRPVPVLGGVEMLDDVDAAFEWLDPDVEEPDTDGTIV